MTFAFPTQNERGEAVKSISGLTGVNNTTTQFSFTEVQGSLGGGSVIYELIVNDFTNADWLQIELDDDGIAHIFVGPQPNGWIEYRGTWTPNGGSRVVHVTIDAFGIPRLWIDGVEIILAVFSVGAGAPPTPPDTIFVQIVDLDGIAAARMSVIHSIFMTSGVFPPATSFCCP